VHRLETDERGGLLDRIRPVGVGLLDVSHVGGPRPSQILELSGDNMVRSVGYQARIEYLASQAKDATAICRLQPFCHVTRRGSACALTVP
jgi:hypothetical protein